MEPLKNTILVMEIENYEYQSMLNVHVCELMINTDALPINMKLREEALNEAERRPHDSTTNIAMTVWRNVKAKADANGESQAGMHSWERIRKYLDSQVKKQLVK